MSSGEFSDQARRVAQNFSWLTLQEVLIRLISLATAMYLARALSPTNYGALGLAFAIVSFFAVLVRAGTGSRANRLTARNHAAVPAIYSDITGIRLTAAAFVITILVLFAGLIAPAFSIPPLMLIVCCPLLLRPALTVAWAFRGLEQMRVTAIGEVAEKILTLLGMLLLVHGIANDVLWAPVAETVAALLVITWMVRRLGRLYPDLHIKFRWRTWPAIAHEAVPLGLASMLGSVYLNGGALLLGMLATSTAAAQFLVAQKIMLTLAILLEVINTAAFSLISRMVHQDARAALGLTAQLLRYYLVITVPLFLLVAFHDEEVPGLLFGPGYAAAGTVLLVLLAQLPFLAISGSLQMVLTAMPRPMAVLSSRLAGAVALLSISVWLIPAYGAVGAAAALIVGEMTSTLLLFLQVRRATGGVPWTARCTAPLLAGAGAAILYKLIFSWPLLIKLPLAALVYCGLALLLKAVTVAECRQLPGLFRVAVQSKK
jgi:O-antigen/teichoic acid export membrane protein